MSAYTLKLDISAVAKLYGIPAPELGIKTPSRTMDKITRSRGGKKMDRHFSEKNNADLITFAKMYQSEVYVCRGTDRGRKLDKRALLEVSEALGHSRISVAAEHYIRF